MGKAQAMPTEVRSGEREEEKKDEETNDLFAIDRYQLSIV